MGIDVAPNAEQVCAWQLFQIGPPGNRVIDDIHSHWLSYLYKFGALADAPYSEFQPIEGWDAVYTYDSLKKYESKFADSFGKKVTKPSLIVVVSPTTSEVDDYFLNKLHKPICIKRKSVYFGPKVSCKRSHIEVVFCPYCGVLSQNAPSGCSHIWRHFGITFVCRACMKFPNETPKKLQEHLRKCREMLVAKATADLAASQGGSGKEKEAYLEAPASISPSFLHGGTRMPRHICLFQQKSGCRVPCYHGAVGYTLPRLRASQGSNLV